jgi:hypothetical protein
MSTIESLDHLRDEFVRLAEAEHQANHPGQPPRSRVRLRTFAAVTAVAFLVAAGAIVVSTHGGAAPSASGGLAGARQVHGSVLQLPLSGRGQGSARSLTGGRWSATHPFPAGRRVSLEQAQVALRRPIPFAHDPLTGRSQMGPVSLVTGARIHGVTDTSVAISYPGSHVAVEYEIPVPYPNPAADYAGYVADDQQSPGLHHLAYVGSVAGRPALIIRRDSDSLGTNPASVEFVLHGIRIVVIGYQPASTLLRLANSIAAGSP